MNRILSGLLLAAAWSAAPALAQDAGGAAGAAAGVTCNDAGIFTQGGAITKLCTRCFFPIMMGTSTGDAREIPAPAQIGPVCTCPGLFGYPTPGVTFGMWQPTHIFEQTRQAYCSPALGAAGNAMFQAAASSVGPMGDGSQIDSGEDEAGKAYFNAHIFNFPVNKVLEGVTSAVCQSAEGANMFSLLWISEIDPTHRVDELALFLTPEATLFSSPPAVAACIADSVAASVYQPIDALWWCHGSWGHGFPYSGTIAQNGHPAREAAASATKLLGSMHRTLRMNLTYSYPGVCADVPVPIMPKSQYKFQVMHPMPEVLDNHWIGETPYLWLSGHIPSVGEDHVNVLWTFQQCCAFNL